MTGIGILRGCGAIYDDEFSPRLYAFDSAMVRFERILDKTLVKQLPGFGANMSRFDYAIYFNMHFDYVSVANEIVGATMISQEAKYIAVFNGESTSFSVDIVLI